MARRLFVSVLVAGLLALATPAMGAAAGAATPRLAPLLPLARGELVVSLGTPPEWMPVSNQPLTLTLFSGRPGRHVSSSENVYIALQGIGRRCTATAAGDRVHPLHELARFYDSRDLVSHQASPFAPSGGAAGGDYTASLAGVVVRQHGATRVCVWLAPSPRRRGLVADQRVTLLDGLFAAAVSALPDASGGSSGYELDAIDVARAFSVAVSGETCGSPFDDGPQPVPDGGPVTESIAIGPDDCSADSTTFAFTGAHAAALGNLTYSDAQAAATPPAVVSLGGCELDPVTGVSVTVVTGYVQAVGCTVAHLLVAPFESGIARGAVVEAQVDGGVADVAPHGTAVDLVVNGRP